MLDTQRSFYATYIPVINLKRPFLYSDYLQIASFFIRKNHEKYYTKMTPQSKDITEKHWQQQLPLLKWKQTFRDTVLQCPKKRKNYNPARIRLGENMLKTPSV